MVRFIAMMAAVILAGLPVGAQQATGSSESAPYVDAPVAQDAGAAKPPVTAQQSSVGEEYIYVLGAFCGAGASTSAAGTKPTAGCGVCGWWAGSVWMCSGCSPMPMKRPASR